MEPIHPAIVWQCRRTADITETLKTYSQLFREKTGLIPDAISRVQKLLGFWTNVPGARAQAENGELAFGTIDSWLIAKLSKEQNHFTEPSNASRTMLFNLKT